jgi:hypothetical protein
MKFLKINWYIIDIHEYEIDIGLGLDPNLCVFLILVVGLLF